VCPFVWPQGWRLDPLLLFVQICTAGSAFTWALESINLRKDLNEVRAPLRVTSCPVVTGWGSVRSARRTAEHGLGREPGFARRLKGGAGFLVHSAVPQDRQGFSTMQGRRKAVGMLNVFLLLMWVPDACNLIRGSRQGRGTYTLGGLQQLDTRSRALPEDSRRRDRASEGATYTLPAPDDSKYGQWYGNAESKTDFEEQPPVSQLSK
jgi:hypothetical protein